MVNKWLLLMFFVLLSVFTQSSTLSKEYCVKKPTDYQNYSGETSLESFCRGMTFSDILGVPHIEMHAAYGDRCCVDLDLTCDQGVEYADIRDINSGDPTIGSKASSQPTIKQNLCLDMGYKTLDANLIITEQARKYDRLFYAVGVCGGKTSSCPTDQFSTELIIDSSSTCDSSIVKANNILVDERDSRFYGGGTAIVYSFKIGVLEVTPTGVCNDKGFDKADNVLSFYKTSGNDRYGYYTAKVLCSSYKGSTPLLSSCSDAGVFAENVSVLDCDSATVSKTITSSNATILSDGKISIPDSEIRDALCSVNNYAILDGVLSIGATNISKEYNVVANCSGNTNKTQECANLNDPCLGDIVSQTSIIPKICTGNVCYRDLCSNVSTPTCVSCNQNTVTFTDALTNETCVVNKNPQVSGDVVTTPFENSTHNGAYNVLCNNGTLTTNSDSTCFKNCSAGSLVSWVDKNGIENCGNKIPNNAKGYYIQGETVTLSSSLTNTGSAKVQCNNGTWEVQSGAVCKLDCGGAITWGSGISVNGLNKYGACSATISTMKDGATLNNVNNTGYSASGKVDLSCSDGVINKSNESCDLDCSSKKVYWGSKCKADTGIKKSGQTAYLTSITEQGSARLSCNDGQWSGLSNASCRYIVSSTYSDSNWSWVGDVYNCSNWTPTTSPDGSNSWTQTASDCQRNRTKIRTHKDIWNDGTTTVSRTETINDVVYNQTSSRTYTSSVVVTPSCLYDSNNYIVEEHREDSDYGSNVTDLDSIDYYYQGNRIYSDVYGTDRGDTVNNTQGSTSGFSKGASKYYEEFDSYNYYEEFEICVN